MLMQLSIGYASLFKGSPPNYGLTADLSKAEDRLAASRRVKHRSMHTLVVHLSKIQTPTGYIIHLTRMYLMLVMRPEGLHYAHRWIFHEDSREESSFFRRHHDALQLALNINSSQKTDTRTNFTQKTQCVYLV